ncbi:porin [Polaromonas sp. C04]|uniref:porin n=1 Tax=Polaromonas sp. C04 TaxID=1945857 RepID=UPI000987174F|nr:porin [Polaromonas sp. C04]OOG53173.1 hypothetical protein B0E49_11935 [Polaromonas sp. C04]
MKKTLLIAAMACTAAAAQAQSSVTLFGVIDTAYEHLSGNALAGSTNRLISSGNNSSRLGFKGVEDLGGGLNASFWLEAGINSQNGTGSTTTTNNQVGGAGSGGLTFNRRSTVSLAGNFGEIRLGRDFAPTYLNLSNFDPFGNDGAGAESNESQALASLNGVQTATRVSNGIGYLLPSNLGGFYGQMTYALGGNSSNTVNGAGQNTSLDGNYVGGVFGYQNGPVNVAIAYGQTKIAAIGNYDQGNIGGSYNFGPATVMAQYDQEKVGSGGALGIQKNNIYMLGVDVPVGPGDVLATYTHDKADNNAVKANQYAVGYVYHLSKRTAIYGTYAHISNNGTGANVATNTSAASGTGFVQGGSSNGIDIGLRTSF